MEETLKIGIQSALDNPKKIARQIGEPWKVTFSPSWQKKHTKLHTMFPFWSILYTPDFLGGIMSSSILYTPTQPLHPAGRLKTRLLKSSHEEWGDSLEEIHWFRKCSRALDPFLKQRIVMYNSDFPAIQKVLAFLLQTGLGVTLHIVSLVPRLTIVTPSSSIPNPIILAGLSPDPEKTRQSEGNPYRCCIYVDMFPNDWDD